MNATAKIPVGILAGFLGAGKTTLLNHILNGAHGRRMAVLVNDFGDINIDAQLVSRIEGETIDLANGCICCTIRDDLVKALLQVIDRKPPPDYIVIETSGVSEPGAAAMGLVMSTRLAATVQLDAVITVVDAEHILELGREQKMLAADQVEAADIVIVNKIDLASEEVIQQIRTWVQGVAPEARVCESEHCRVPLDLLFGIGPARRSEQFDPHASEHAHHGASFHSWSWTHSEPLDLQSTYALFRSMPPSIFRAKGLLFVEAVPERQVILQMVGRRVTLSRGEPWSSGSRQTRIVLIGQESDLDEQDLASRLELCLAKNAPPSDNRFVDAVAGVLRGH